LLLPTKQESRLNPEAKLIEFYYLKMHFSAAAVRAGQWWL
jgi:hypothetical protein